MRILMVFQNDFRAPSEKQALGLAQELARRGHRVLMLVGGDAKTGAQEGDVNVDGLQIDEYRFAGPRLRRGDRELAREFDPALIHCWNSRIPTVVAARQFARATASPVVVHFEDDEWRIPPQGFAGERRVHGLIRRVRRHLWWAHPRAWWHSNRASLRWVARRAHGLDALTPAIAEEVRQRLTRDCSVVLPVTPRPPGGEAQPTPVELPAALGDARLAVYTGALLPVYLPDILLGMRAVAEARRRGAQLAFVHAGTVFMDLDTDALRRDAGLPPEACAFLGYVPGSALLPLLKEAAVLLQPGHPNEFNRLRLPSKLQTYLASGTPTITFAAGFGELLEDRTEVLKTYTADPGELADRIMEAIGDSGLRRTLSQGGPGAAARLFDTEANTDALLAHYAASLAQDPPT